MLDSPIQVFQLVSGAISALVNAANPQAYDTIVGEAKKHYGVTLNKNEVIAYYYALGFTTKGVNSAYRYAVQILDSPRMILYMYSKNGQSFLDRLAADQKSSSGYTYGQDWLSGLIEYIQSGNPARINQTWLNTFSDTVPDFFRYEAALIPAPAVAAQIQESVSEAPQSSGGEIIIPGAQTPAQSSITGFFKSNTTALMWAGGALLALLLFSGDARNRR
ncbi:MAG: hypothetical protein WC329_04345 [Candidatus Omnitrophota bacterium]|jgi:hypothetical protein